MGGEALLNAARRYCVDAEDRLVAPFRPYRNAQTAERIRALHGPRAWRALQALGLEHAPPPDQVPYPAGLTLTEERLRNARVSMLSAILEEVDRLRPEKVCAASAEDARQALLTAGERARVWGSMFLRAGPDEPRVVREEPRWSPEQQGAAEDERASYLVYVASVTEPEAAAAEPVPYRHILGDAKRSRLRRRLRQRWSATPGMRYWYPLESDVVPAGEDVLAVQDAYFHREVGAESLRGILRRRGIRRVWQVEESALIEDREQDPSWCTFHQSGGETYWSSSELDWLVYASHESSLTFAGGWLVRAVKHAWPSWEQRVYEGYHFE